jgi:NAD(P)-dependent dehydrogenase (short-subunit alcohol dehydrogenase family)
MSSESETPRTALVTGASRGIGLAIARGLAERGLAVVLGVRDADAGEAVRATFPRPDMVAVLAVDVGSPLVVARALGELARRDLHIDVLVNNAGILPDGDVFSTPDELMREAMEVHFFGPLALSRGLVPAMQRARYGRVVNVSSDWGSFTKGLEGPAAYSISKAALNALTVKLARDAGPHVKVNAMCPGWVRTRMGGSDAELSPEEGADTALWLATLTDSGPTGGYFQARKPLPW